MLRNKIYSSCSETPLFVIFDGSRMLPHILWFHGDFVRVIRKLAQNDFSVFQDLNLEHILDIVVPLIGPGGINFVELGADVIGAGHDSWKFDLNLGLHQLPGLFIAEGDSGKANRAGGHMIDIRSYIRFNAPFNY